MGADCVQIFLSDPQGWEKPAPRKDAAELRGLDAAAIRSRALPDQRLLAAQQRPLRLAQDPAADLRRRRGGRRGRRDRPRRLRRGRHRRGRRPLAADAGDARPRSPVLIENTAGGENAVARRFDALARLWEAVSKADVERRGRLLLRHLPRARGRRGSAPTRSSACWRSSGRSTCCTPTTRATRPAPAPTATPTSARGEIGAEVLREMIHAAGPPVVVETPGRAPKDDAGGPRVRPRGARLGGLSLQIAWTNGSIRVSTVGRSADGADF